MPLGRTALVVSTFLLTFVSRPDFAQTAAPPRYEIYGGYLWQSNYFNGLPEAHNGMNGWQAGVGFPAWHNLRPRVEYSHLTGTNLGASEQVFSVMGGGQYEHAIGRERLFVDAMFGDLGMNRYWGPQGTPGESASFTTSLGGGIDTPIDRHFAVRVEADWRNENLALIKAVSSTTPYRVPGLPQNFALLSTSLVWMPGEARARGIADMASSSHHPDQELIAESLNSFGHFHIFANSWWSILNVAGVEYARHSWGQVAGARMDYVAEILPVVILRQPSVTDLYGNVRSGANRTAVAGLGVSPIGLRMMWLDKHPVKPYYEIKGGMIGFTKKSLSNYASYENFSLQQSLGAQFRLTDRWEMRTAFSFFHFSNAFVVPINPGVDEMAWSVGLSRKFQRKTTPSQ